MLPPAESVREVPCRVLPGGFTGQARLLHRTHSSEVRRKAQAPQGLLGRRARVVSRSRMEAREPRFRIGDASTPGGDGVAVHRAREPPRESSCRDSCLGRALHDGTKMSRLPRRPRGREMVHVDARFRPALSPNSRAGRQHPSREQPRDGRGRPVLPVALRADEHARPRGRRVGLRCRPRPDGALPAHARRGVLSAGDVRLVRNHAAVSCAETGTDG